MLIGCESKTPVTTEEIPGELLIIKSCTGGGSVSIYKKSGTTSQLTHQPVGGTVILKGTGLRSKISGCPSSVNFTCEAIAHTEARFGINTTGNERYTCQSGSKVTFSPLYNSQPTYTPTTPYSPQGLHTSSPTTSTLTTQSSAPIMGSDIWLIGKGPLKPSAISPSLIIFQITAGRQIPLPCSIELSCP